jgi:predicted phosphodiesterase
VEKTYPQKILFLSDVHIGGNTSNFAAYQANIIERMTHYDHVAMIGDNWELFYVDKHHVKALSKLMEVLTGKDSHHWKKELNDSGTARSGVENVIHSAQWFTTEFLERFPNVHLHVIGGNHENIRRFRNEFARIQEAYPNFEWSPQAVRIGDALITHGHLPLSGKTDEQYPQVRLRDAERKQNWKQLIRIFGPAEHKLQNRRRCPEKASAILGEQMEQWDDKNDFYVSHDRHHEPLDMGWVKHIFFGHTHIKFDNFKRQEDGITFHNTGAIVKLTSEKAEDMGILEGDLNADGTVTNVRPVRIAKDMESTLPRRLRAEGMAR